MPTIAITALTDPVAIVHIPAHLASAVTTKIYWTIDRASSDSPEFFNLTSNRLEIAIFASHDLVMQEWGSSAETDVLISTTWRVFEITSGDEGDSGNYDSPHLRHVSAPLARAGISILYQSSYFTDFLLVKESDFGRAAEIFAAQGWHVESTSIPTTPNRRRSQLLSPVSPSPQFPTPASTRASPPLPAQPEITVLLSDLACVGFSRTAEVRSSEKVRKFLVWPERAVEEVLRAESEDGFVLDQPGEVESESEVSEVVHNNRSSTLMADADRRPFISYTRNEDGASLMTEINILRSLFPPGLEEGFELQSGGELSWYGDNDSDVDWEEGSIISVSEPSSAGHSEMDGDRNASTRNNGEKSNRSSASWSKGQTHTPPPDVGNHPAPSSSTYQTLGSGHRKTLSLPPTPGVGLDGSCVDFSGRPRSYTLEEESDDDGDAGGEVCEIPIKWTGRGPPRMSEREGGQGKGKKRCLQLDLRGVGEGHEGASYHLEKSGLVTRFSDLLTSSRTRPIRILYSSTFHTANILVEARDVKRAKSLLERQRR